jgi:hypothetical protein
MATKPRLTHEQHTELGRALAGLRDELVHRYVQLANAYPLQGREALPGRKLEAAFRALDAARSELEAAMFREHPDTAQTTVYYPHAEDRTAVGADPLAVVLAELARIEALPTVQHDDGRANTFAVGARWTIRMIREAIDRGTPADSDAEYAPRLAVVETEEAR